MKTNSAEPPPSTLRRCLRLCTTDGLVSIPICTMSLPVNVFLIALFTKALGLSATSIGLITAVPFLCNFLQLGVTPLLARWRPYQTLTVIGARLHLLTWLALGLLLPWLPRHDPAAAGRWLAIWFFVSSFFSSIMGVAWNSWIQEWVPGRLRGKYFGRRNGALQFSTITFLLIAGWVLSRWDYAIPAFQAIVVGAAVLRVFSIHCLRATPSPPPMHDAAFTMPVRAQFELLRGNRSLLLFIAFGAVWQFATNCFGPFYQVFMFDQLRFSALDIGLLTVCGSLGGALSLPAWGRLLDHHGNKSVMTVSLLLWQSANLLWCFLEPANRNLCYFMWAWGGVTSAGFVLGQFTLLLKVLPTSARSLAIGLNLAITSLMAAIAPVLGGLVLGWGLAHWPDRTLPVYHTCFILQPVLASLGTIILLRLQEPRAGDLSTVVGAMRNIRTLSGLFGLSFLTNYLFVKPARKNPS